MSDLLVKNGRLLDPARGVEMEGGAVVVRDGLIERVLLPGEAAGLQWEGESFDAGGALVLPGLIDIHTHLRDPGQTHKEDIETGTRAAASGGFTTVCCMPNTEPPIDSGEVAEAIVRKAERAGYSRVFPVGAISLGREGSELAPHTTLHRAGCRLFSDDGSDTADSSVLLDAMATLKQLGARVTIHAEDPTLSGDGVMHEGAGSAELGVEGQYQLSEEVAISRALLLAEHVEAPVHIAHITTERGVRLVQQARERGVQATCEVTPHHLLLEAADTVEYGAQAKVNPPLRTALDRQALIELLENGTIDCIASDHAPHTALEKSRGLEHAPFGFTGLDLSAALTWGLVQEDELSLERWVEAQTAAPARVLGLYDRDEGGLGKLEEGAAGDLTVFDQELEWTATEDELESKSANTPFLGRELTGRAVATVVGGEVVFRRGPGN